MGLDSIKLIAGSLGAVVALISGSLTLSDRFGFDLWERPVLEWAPEEFIIEDGYVLDGFKVIVARTKLRDDCEVIGFSVQLRDSEYLVHPAVTSVTKFSGPAGDRVELFGYRVYVPEMHVHKIAFGLATLSGQIKYSCPEGEQIVSYPNHRNLSFRILGLGDADER